MYTALHCACCRCAARYCAQCIIQPANAPVYCRYCLDVQYAHVRTVYCVLAVYTVLYILQYILPNLNYICTPDRPLVLHYYTVVKQFNTTKINTSLLLKLVKSDSHHMYKLYDCMTFPRFHAKVITVKALCASATSNYCGIPCISEYKISLQPGRDIQQKTFPPPATPLYANKPLISCTCTVDLRLKMTIRQPSKFTIRILCS